MTRKHHPGNPHPAAATAVRQDVYVFNTATGFLVTSEKMGGKELDSDSKQWQMAAKAGKLLPIELYQDDSFCIRVVVDDVLTKAEEDEWVGQLSCGLAVPDGKLVICGGAEFVMEPEVDAAMEDYVRRLAIPPGNYDVRLLCYLSGVNGHALLQSAAGGKEPEPVGKYFRRTRAGQFPLWLRRWCAAYATTDPGHESEWTGSEYPQGDEEFIDFLLHLTPAKDKLTPVPVDQYGFVPISSFQPRTPKKCPYGLLAEDVIGHEASAAAAQPINTLDIIGETRPWDLEPVTDGPVQLPLAQLAQIVQVAWFANNKVTPGISFKLSSPEQLEARFKGIDFVSTKILPGELRIHFPRTEGRWDGLGYTKEVVSHVGSIPDGTELEVSTIASSMYGPKPHGLFRFKGVVLGNIWHISECCPPASAKKLEHALALARDCVVGAQLQAASADSAREGLTNYLNEWKGLAKPEDIQQDGPRLVFAIADDGMAPLLAVEVFRLDFKDIWTVVSDD